MLYLLNETYSGYIPLQLTIINRPVAEETTTFQIYLSRLKTSVKFYGVLCKKGQTVNKLFST